MHAMHWAPVLGSLNRLRAKLNVYGQLMILDLGKKTLVFTSILNHLRPTISRNNEAKRSQHFSTFHLLLITQFCTSLLHLALAKQICQRVCMKVNPQLTPRTLNETACIIPHDSNVHLKTPEFSAENF